MSSLAQALGYLSEVTKFASQGPVSYSIGECVTLVRPYTVIAGVLSKTDTDRLVDDFCNVQGGRLDGYGRVPVVISLRTLVYDDPRRAAKGLLLLPAMLDINGRLSVDLGTQQPWIPLDRLSAPGSSPRAITVASLSDYRHFQIEHQAEFANPVTWGVYVDLALGMFDSICKVDEDGLRDSKCRVDTELCRIKCLAFPEPTLTASNVFAHLAQQADTPQGLPATVKPFFSDATSSQEDEAPTLTLSRLDIQQAEAEREAAASKAQDSAKPTPEPQEAAAKKHKGKSKSTPPKAGQGKLLDAGVTPALPAAHDDRALDAPTDPTSLRATDRLMENAKLRRGACDATCDLAEDTYDALRLLCSDVRDPLSCVQAPLGDEALRLAAALAADRVTECAVRGDNEPYFFFGVSSGVFRRRVTAALDLAFTGNDSLGEPWLRRGFISTELPRVAEEFLDRAGEFLDRRPATPEAAVRSLGARLRRIDQLRCELVDGYAEVRTASDLASQQEERLLALARLRDEHAHAKARLEYWSHLAEQSRAHRALGRGRGGQRVVIQEGAEPDEGLVLGCSTLDEVVNAYRDLVRTQQNKLDSTRRETAKLELRVRRHSLSGTKGAEDVNVLAQLCHLDRAGKRSLDSLFSGGVLSADKLDKVLDRTVRACEFWLAVHLYEARELEAGRVRPMPRWRSVATIYEIPGLVGKFTGRPPIDTVVCLRSERMRTPQALSCLALARRAIVMGDPSGIGPRWELDPEADHDIARLTMDGAGWGYVRTHEVGASSPQRFLGATLKACTSQPRTFYELTSLAPSRGVVAEYREEAFYGGQNDLQPELGVGSLHVFQEGESDPERVGQSRRNHGEAQRLVDWVVSSFPHLQERYGEGDDSSRQPILCVVAPYASQAQLISNLLSTTDASIARQTTVCTVRQASGATAPVVAFSGTDTVAQLDADFAFGASSLLCVASALAGDLFAVFCDPSWKQEGAQRCPAVAALFECATPWTKPEPKAQLQQNAQEPSQQSDSEVAPTQEPKPDQEGSPEDSQQDQPQAEEHSENEPEAKADAPSAQSEEVPEAKKNFSAEEPSEGEAVSASESHKDESKGSEAAEEEPSERSENDGSRNEEEPSAQAEEPKVYATLAQVLHELFVDQKLPVEPEEDTAFRWLQRDGFVMVSSARDGSVGWVPTQRGIRCGMAPRQHDDGSLWCGFSNNSAEYVLASVQLHSEKR